MKRILVVDDCESIREAFEIILREEGFNVFLASDGAEAIDVLDKDSAFDLVITDGQMPRKRGEEVIRHIKLNYPHIKTIFVSSDEGTLALAAGVNAVISKANVNFAILVNMVRKLASS